MESRSIQIKCKKNKNISLRVIPGHFATNHSHINYYIDMTGIKYHSLIAKQAGETMAEHYAHNKNRRNNDYHRFFLHKYTLLDNIANIALLLYLKIKGYVNGDFACAAHKFL